MLCRLKVLFFPLSNVFADSFFTFSSVLTVVSVSSTSGSGSTSVSSTVSDSSFLLSSLVVSAVSFFVFSSSIVSAVVSLSVSSAVSASPDSNVSCAVSAWKDSMPSSLPSANAYEGAIVSIMTKTITAQMTLLNVFLICYPPLLKGNYDNRYCVDKLHASNTLLILP